MSNEPEKPVIIKKKKVAHAEEAHHGGAWKVAYADFVTAMMAFFLLMWLLNATTEKQRKGLADYFSPAVPISRISGGGEESLWGGSLAPEDDLAADGTGAAQIFSTDQDKARGDTGVTTQPSETDPPDRGAPHSDRLIQELKMLGGESMRALQAMPHVVTRLSDEGLVIELHEIPGSRLFGPDGTTPTAVMTDTLAVVADVLDTVTNDIAVGAHLAARPVVVAENPRWEMSTLRAQATRESLEAAGLADGRIARVSGFADRAPSEDNPMALRNSRVEVIVLRDQL